MIHVYSMLAGLVFMGLIILVLLALGGPVIRLMDWRLRLSPPQRPLPISLVERLCGGVIAVAAPIVVLGAVAILYGLGRVFLSALLLVLP